jgi:hypothetical protein
MFPDTRDAAQCATKLIVGQGLGLSPYDSMAGLHLIKGKVVLAANLMAAAIKRSGKYDYRATTTPERCVIDFIDTRSNEVIGSTTWTLEDAKRAGLGGDNWRKYPKSMLFARCISAGYREHCPDALGAAPVYVESHGEFEVDEPAPSPAPARQLPGPSETSLPLSGGEDSKSPPFEEEKLSGNVERVPVSCQVIREGNSARGPWKLYGITTEDGYQLETFKEPNGIHDCIAAGQAMTFKNVEWNVKFRSYRFQFADPVPYVGSPPDDGKDPVSVKPITDEEVPW